MNRITKILQYLLDRSAEKHMPNSSDKTMGTAYNYTLQYIFDELLTNDEKEQYNKMQANPTCDCDVDLFVYRKRVEDRLLEHLPWKSSKQKPSA